MIDLVALWERFWGWKAVCNGKDGSIFKRIWMKVGMMGMKRVWGDGDGDGDGLS